MSIAKSESLTSPKQRKEDIFENAAFEDTPRHNVDREERYQSILGFYLCSVKIAAFETDGSMYCLT